MDAVTIRSYLMNLALSICIMIAIDAIGYGTSVAAGSSFAAIVGVFVQFPGAIALAFAFDCFKRGRVQDTYKIRWWIQSAANLLVLAIVYNYLHFPIQDIRRVINAP